MKQVAKGNTQAGLDFCMNIWDHGTKEAKDELSTRVLSMDTPYCRELHKLGIVNLGTANGQPGYRQPLAIPSSSALNMDRFVDLSQMD